MDFSFLNSIFASTLLIKIATLIAIGFYVVFTLVVFTQVRVMGEVLVLPNAKVLLKTISIIHIALAISLFLGAFVIL